MPKRSTITLALRTCSAAETRPKRYHVWDREVAGFGLRVEPTGQKTFIAKYRADGGGRKAIQKVVTIGRFGTVTPDQARKRAREILGGVAIGEDPAGDIRAQRQQMSVTELIDFYEANGCYIQRGKRQGFPMKERTKTMTLARLRHHVVPLLGKRRVGDLTPGDIERFFQDVEAGKTAKKTKLGPRRLIVVRGGNGAARKVFRDLSAVFSFAGRHEIVGRNPCERAAVRKTDNHKDRYLTLEEITRLGAAIDELGSEGANPKALDIMRLWALTGCRRDEIAGLRWKEVDFAHACLRFSDSKTGKSIRPLGAPALAILQAVARDGDVSDDDFIFPADFGGGHFQGYKTPWSRAVRKADLAGVSPHTLRHTMGSTTVSSGEALGFAGAILGHSNPRSTAIYAHVQLDPARDAADRVSAIIAAALAGAESVGLNVKHQHATDDEILLAGVAKALGRSGPDADKLRALLQMFAS